MDERELGRSGIKVPVVGMGCWSFAGDGSWGPVDDEEAVLTVREALDLGVRLFDTAEGYGRGRSEELLGRALGGRRKEALIATKASPPHLSEKELPRALEASLARLRTDYVDLYYMHWPSREVPFAETMGAMERLKEAGKVRSIGVSNFGAGDLDDLAKAGVPDADQLPYNLFWRAIESEILPKCRELGTGVVAYGPLAMGLLTGKFGGLEDVPDSNRKRTRLYEPRALELAFKALGKLRETAGGTGVSLARLSLAWLIAQRGVTAVIPGAKNRKQLGENVGAAEVKLSDDVLEEMRALSEPLRSHLGPDPDLWGASRFR